MPVFCILFFIILKINRCIAASLSTSFSSLATTMTTTRNELLSTKDKKQTKREKTYTMRKQKGGNHGLVPFRRETKGVSRWLYDPSMGTTFPWRKVDFVNCNSVRGFDLEHDPFGVVSYFHLFSY